MWHILESEDNARIYTGFKEGVTKDIFEASLANGTLPDLLNVEKAEKGDTFFTPAGRIHAIGAGTVLVEIQQTSDVTYRISDWNRKNPGPEKRELHLDLAKDAIDFSETSIRGKIKYEAELNKIKNLVSCEYFNTNLLHFNNMINREYHFNDSFVIYICLGGEFHIGWDGSSEKVVKGETVLLPAMIKEVALVPKGDSKLLEVYIKSDIPI